VPQKGTLFILYRIAGADLQSVPVAQSLSMPKQRSFLSTPVDRAAIRARIANPRQHLLPLVSFFLFLSARTVSVTLKNKK